MEPASEQSCEEPVRDPRGKETGGSGSRLRRADGLGQALADRGEGLSLRDGAERLGLEPEDRSVAHPFVEPPDAQVGRLRRERRRFLPHHLDVLPVEALAHGVDRPPTGEKAQGGSRLESELPPGVWCHRGEALARQDGRVLGVERLRHRPFEPREVGGVGAAAREDRGEGLDRQVLREIPACVSQRRARRRMHHEVGLHEVVEGVCTERTRERPEVLAQAVVDAYEVGVRVDPEALGGGEPAVAAQEGGERCAVPVAFRR